MAMKRLFKSLIFQQSNNYSQSNIEILICNGTRHLSLYNCMASMHHAFQVGSLILPTWDLTHNKKIKKTSINYTVLYTWIYKQEALPFLSKLWRSYVMFTLNLKSEICHKWFILSCFHDNCQTSQTHMSDLWNFFF